MNIKERNIIADKIAEHINKVGIDEPVEEILNSLDLSLRVKTLDVSEHRKRTASVRNETICDMLSVLTGMDVSLNENGKLEIKEAEE